MRRFIRSRRTRSNVIDTSGLREQFIRDLTLEADALVKQLTQQFARDLQTQAAQLYQGIVPGDGTVPTASANGELNTIGSLGQLLGLGARYLVSRPRTSRNTQETERSRGADMAFRLSQAQAMAEAQNLIGKGEKNL